MNKVLEREKVNVTGEYKGKVVLAAAVVRTLKGWKTVLIVEGMGTVSENGYRSSAVAQKRVFDMLDSPLSNMVAGGSHGA
ncbi:hypothetical protein [Devosia sp. A449]